MGICYILLTMWSKIEVKRILNQINQIIFDFLLFLEITWFQRKTALLAISESFIFIPIFIVDSFNGLCILFTIIVKEAFACLVSSKHWFGFW